MIHQRLLALVCLLLSWPVMADDEPKNTAELTVRDGLEVWLDASVLNESRRAMGLREAGPGKSLDIWPDGSGHARHAVQRSRGSQPKTFRLGDQTVVRFDGQDDFMSVTGPKDPRRELTIFVLAAPRSNAGYFRALFAAGRAGHSDFSTGLNLDLGPAASQRLDFISVEGAGFGGARDMTEESTEFGKFHTFEVMAAPDKPLVMLGFDGRWVGKRDRSDSLIHLEELTLGARNYSNSGDPPFASGFLDGDIAQVLVYNRALKPDERKEVLAYLEAKRSDLHAAMAAGESGHLLQTVSDPPPVQMLVPGFTVKKMPLQLTNINNVKYREDGKLVALGYNGNVWLLSDTDGDGLEDKADLFWENKGVLRSTIGMALTPPGYKHGRGVIVASKMNISLIVDTDGDDKADKQIIVAQGWKESIHGVDALGVAMDKEGAVYYGLGTEFFAGPYMIDKETGKAKYDVKGERGTIMRVAPDFSSREVIATGIRFPVAMAFNRHGDLFCTDQEGATWVPNGNPLDELLHIQKGRHYGFPARHPKHLPDVIDEPSTFDYGPQHQSTCGLNFNEPVHGGPVFGPDWWAGDAIVTGSSRGKIYRTKLVKTGAGYVAQNQVIACLHELTIDACVSPRGALVVATHSGPPDWGSGPEGMGTLYKIFYTDRDAPQPLLAWPAGETEVRIAFDRPLDPTLLKDIASQIKIEYGPYVSAGDRFETMRPGYEVVDRQQSTPRHDLPIHGVSVTPDHRTLILTAGPHTQNVTYAVTLPQLGLNPSPPGRGQGEGLSAHAPLPQHTTMDLQYTLHGVRAEWKDEKGDVQWSGWLPHWNLDVNRTFTSGSADHDALWEMLEKKGLLALATRVNEKNMLRPAVQPGSSTDFEYAVRENVGFNVAIEHWLGVATEFIAEPPESGFKTLKLTGPTGTAPVSLALTFKTNEDERQRPVQLHRFYLPWANTSSKPVELAKRAIPQIEGGDWVRGREVYFSEQALCSKCHAYGGRGGHIGPDLSNLIHRDYASVLRDITEPGAALNPDHLTYAVSLKGGGQLIGVPRSSGDGKIILGDASGAETVFDKDKAASMRSVPISIMPAGLHLVLGEEKMRDLLTFLLTVPLEPAPIETADAPPPRSLAEVKKVLEAGAAENQPLPQPLPKREGSLRILLVDGVKDHGPGEHDYPLWKKRWATLLAMGEGVTVETAAEWPSDEQVAKADVMVFYQHGMWDDQRAKTIDAYLARGGGLVYIHFAVDGRPDPAGFARRLGLAWKGGNSKFRHGPLDLTFTDHPITRGLPTLHLHDESYWNLVGEGQGIEVLGTGVEEGKAQPLLWTRQVGKGRVFVSIPGHFNWTFDDPLFRIVVLRAIAWTANQPAERLTDLATIGARIGP